MSWPRCMEADGERSKQIEEERGRFLRAPLVIGGDLRRAANCIKIPVWEQELSAGAVCQNILIAAHALGFVGQWVTEWYAYHPVVKQKLGLAPGERIAGFIYLGTVNRGAGRTPAPRDGQDREPLLERGTCDRTMTKSPPGPGFASPGRNSCRRLPRTREAISRGPRAAVIAPSWRGSASAFRCRSFPGNHRGQQQPWRDLGGGAPASARPEIFAAGHTRTNVAEALINRRPRHCRG